MFITKITLLLLGTIASVSYAVVYPSLAISNNFAVTGTLGLVNGVDAYNNYKVYTLKEYGFKGKGPVTI